MVDGDDAGSETFAVNELVGVPHDSFGAVGEALFDDAFADPFGLRNVIGEELSMSQDEIFHAGELEFVVPRTKDFSARDHPVEILFQAGYGLALSLDGQFHDYSPLQSS